MRNAVVALRWIALVPGAFFIYVSSFVVLSLLSKQLGLADNSYGGCLFSSTMLGIMCGAHIVPIEYRKRAILLLSALVVLFASGPFIDPAASGGLQPINYLDLGVTMAGAFAAWFIWRRQDRRQLKVNVVAQSAAR